MVCIYDWPLAGAVNIVGTLGVSLLLQLLLSLGYALTQNINKYKGLRPKDLEDLPTRQYEDLQPNASG